MTDSRSPLQHQLHRIRIWMVVIINAAFLLFSVVTILVGPTPITWDELMHGSHKVRTWASMVAVAGLLGVTLFPRYVKLVYLPYLLALLWIMVQEARGTVVGQVMPYQLALWLSVNMAVLFLVFGVRWGLWAFGLVMTVLLLTLAGVSHLITGYLLVDWISTLIVMTVAGATSFMLMSMIERNMLVNERALLDLRSARTDAVTGVPGRAVMEEHLDDLVGQAQRQGTPLSVVMADLDHFKSVNDVHGHKVGDDVLREFAERAVSVMGAAGGVVGRWGGEEFMVILPNCEYGRAFELAEQLCLAVNDRPFHVWGQPGVRVTASFGVASLQEVAASTTDPADGVYHQADQALYAAKRSGRNKVA